MATRLFAAIAVLTGMTAAPVQAQDAEADYFALFDRFCVATGGDMGKAIAAAEAEGWIAAPDAMVAEMRNPNAPEAAIRLSAAPDAAPMRLLLSVSPASPERHDTRVGACAVEPAAGSALDSEHLVRLTSARLGIEQAFLPTWLYSGEGPFADESELMLGEPGAMYARAAETPLHMVNLMDGPGLALLRMGR